MSNKDINNLDASESNSEIKTSMKDSMHLFSFSLLKSKTKRTLSQYNSFNYDFSTENTEPHYIKKKDVSKTAKNRKISLIDDDNSSSLKTLNIEVPSSEKLSEESFKNDFLNEYKNSFAYYCGISKDQFNDIYIKNRYIPILNEFGDINISINHIVDLLKTYSIDVKGGKKSLKHRFHKYFRTLKNKNTIKKKTQHMFKINRIQTIQKPNLDDKIINDHQKKENYKINKVEEKINENYNQISSLITIKKNNNNYNYSDSHMKNIKNKLIQNKGRINIPNKTLIQKQQLSRIPINTSSLGIGFMNKSNLNMTNNSFLFSNNNLSSDANRKQILNNINNNSSLGLGYSAIPQIPESKQNILSPSNNNFFNFSNPNIKFVQSTNSNNINNNIVNNNINYNPQINNQLSPQISPRYLLNDLFSPFSPYSNFQSPRIISPTYTNNIFQDHFTYNNINGNGNSFFFVNSPITINNNNININNLDYILLINALKNAKKQKKGKT